MPTEEEIKRLQKKEQYLSYFCRFRNFFSSLPSRSLFAKSFLPVFLLLLILTVGIWLRMQPANISYAETTVDTMMEDRIYKQFLLEAHTKNPSFPLAEKERFARNRLENFKKLPAYQAERNKQVEELKNLFRPEDAPVYPLEMDAYHHLFFTKNVLKYGSMFDTEIDGVRYDTFKFPPTGRIRPDEHFFPHFAAWFYRFTHSLFGFSLLESFVLIPVVLSTLILILFFLFGYRFFGLAGAFFVGLLAAVESVLGVRGILGFTDTDMLNILLSFAAVFCVLLAFDDASKQENMFSWKSLFWVLIAGLSIGLFAFTWSGWWYIFIIILLSIALFIGCSICSLFFTRRQTEPKQPYPKQIKQTLVLFLSFFLASGIFTSFFTGFSTFFGFLTRPFSVSSSLTDIFTQTASGVELLPNTYRFFVSELQVVPFKTFVSDFGGALPLSIFFLGFVSLSILAFSLMKNMLKRDSVTWVFLYILLFVYAAITGYMTFRVIRFVYYFAVPFILFSGFFFAQFFSRWAEQISVSFRIEKKLIQTLVVILFLLYVGFSPFPPFCDHGKCKQSLDIFKEKPAIYDDGLEQIMDLIKTQTPPDAIITSWWTEGNFIKSQAERRSTIDAASQNMQHLLWVASALASDDENKAVAALQLVDCGSYVPYYLLTRNTIIDPTLPFANGTVSDSYHAFKILQDLLSMDKDQSASYLQALANRNMFSSSIIPELLNKTKCNPVEGYFLVSDAFREFTSVWSFYATFDVDRAKIFNLKDDKPAALSFMQQELNATQKEAEDLLLQAQSIQTDAELLDFFSRRGRIVEILCLPQKDAFLRCVTGYKNSIVEFNIDTLNKKITYGRGPQDVFASLVWADATGYHEQSLQSSSSSFLPSPSPKNSPLNMVFGVDSQPVSVVLTTVQKEGKTVVLLADQPLQKSMYVRLNYLNGAGLSKFSLLGRAVSNLKGNLYVWKVLWPGEKGERNGG